MRDINQKQQPICLIFAGPNGAGKTTFAMDYLPRVANCNRFINADLIAAGLSPLAPDVQAFAAGRLLLKEIAVNIELRRSFAFETTLSGLRYVQLIKSLRLKDWRVETIYLALPSMELAQSRVAERVRHGGHGIPGDVLKRRFFRSIIHFFDDCVQLPDQVTCYCNAGTEPELVFTQQHDCRIVENDESLRQLENLKNYGA